MVHSRTVVLIGPPSAKERQESCERIGFPKGRHKPKLPATYAKALLKSDLEKENQMRHNNASKFGEVAEWPKAPVC